MNLTEADKFYIQANRNKTAKELAAAIEKHEDIIKSYLLSLDNNEHVEKKKKGQSPLFKKLSKRRGAVALNSEVVMASEEVEKLNPINIKPNPNPHRYRGVHGEDITTIREVDSEEE